MDDSRENAAREPEDQSPKKEETPFVVTGDALVRRRLRRGRNRLNTAKAKRVIDRTIDKWESRSGEIDPETGRWTNGPRQHLVSPEEDRRHTVALAARSLLERHERGEFTEQDFAVLKRLLQEADACGALGPAYPRKVRRAGKKRPGRDQSQWYPPPGS